MLRRLIAAAGALALVAVSARGDSKLLPQELRTFDSPSRGYRLEVRGPAHWATPQARAALFAITASGRRQIWSKTFPQRFGPGLVLVSDSGRVLMLDEGMRVTSSYAVLVLARDGSQIARHDLDEIAAVSGLSSETLVRTAKVGPWMSAQPALRRGMDVATVEAGGVPLTVDLRAGRLSRAQR